MQCNLLTERGGHVVYLSEWVVSVDARNLGRPLATSNEVLTFWKFLVVDGVWQVHGHGVVGGKVYFDEAHGSRKVVELAGMQTEVDFQAPWSAAPAY